VFPPQHLVVIRRAVWEADKSLARRITDAFVACEAHFHDAIRSFPYASPWLDLDLEAEDALMPGNGYAHGVEENRQVMELFCEEAHRLGLTQRRVTVDEYFAEFLAS
jgi:4,5-dihydroxyphthalate decarboxylase